MSVMDGMTSAQNIYRRIVRIFRKYPTLWIPVVFAAGFIIRLVFLPNRGFEADISFWKSWGLAVYDHGIVWGIKNTNNNYPTAFAYVLGLMTKTYSFFADPHNFQQYWSNTNSLFLTISKLPAVFADFGIFAIILYFGKYAAVLGFPQFSSVVYILAAASILLNPITVIDGAWWGQVDSLGVFVFLIAVLLALKKRPYLAGFIYMASMMTKLQNMVYGPVFFIFLWQLTGFSGLIRGVAGAATAFIGLNWEFFIAKEMKLVFDQLTVNYDYFPFMSLNAYNLWWIVAKANGMHMLDKFSVVGMTNAKTTGLYLFASSYLYACIIMVKETVLRMVKRTIEPPTEMEIQNILYRFFTAMIVVAGAFFLFQTESHDRYAFPIIVYLPVWLLFFLWTGSSKKERLSIFTTKLFKISAAAFIIFTIVYFFNLHNALVDNYPQNGLPLLRDMNLPVFTLTTAYLQMILFGVFLFAVTRHVPGFFYIIPVSAFAALMLVSNLPLITKSPVYITKFFPIISQQNYGVRRVDMPVALENNSKTWSRLSVQYAFYRHGYGTHAKSYQQFNINGLFKKFTTDYGIDTEAGPNGSATFEIYGDDKPLFVSKPIKRFDLPKHIEVDVTGVKMLGLVTNDAGDGINDDHTDWLNAMLWP